MRNLDQLDLDILAHLFRDAGMTNKDLAALVGVAGLPCEMRIFPQSRFGQFCSAQAMLRSICTVIAGPG